MQEKKNEVVLGDVLRGLVNKGKNPASFDFKEIDDCLWLYPTQKEKRK